MSPSEQQLPRSSDSPPSKRSLHSKETNVRKRARSSSPQPSTCRQGQPQSAGPLEPCILSLPDETISLIFSHLGASDTSGSFEGPRHAFSLALTDTRLLGIFRTHLTRITPDILNDAPPISSPRHMLSVLRLAGDCVRELHLRDSHLSILRNIPAVCPRLKTLSIRDAKVTDYVSDLREVLSLPIQKLAIEAPLTESLRLLVPPPQELCLTSVRIAQAPELIPILRNPPRKLHLHIYYNGWDSDYEELPADLKTSLCEACPEIEEVSVKALYDDESPDANKLLFEEALRVAPMSRRSETSKCMKMTLEGDVLELFDCANTNALLEMTQSGENYIIDQGHVYPTSMQLHDKYLATDLSRLEVVYVHNWSPLWKEPLSKIRLKRAFLEGAKNMECLEMNVDVVEIPADVFYGTNWEKFRGVKEVRLTADLYLSRTAEQIAFFMSLACLLYQFRGERVYIDDYQVVHVKMHAFGLGDIFEDLKQALRRFEARGGDAATVRKLIDGVQVINR